MSLHLYLNHTGGKFVVTLKQGRMRMPYLTDGLHSKGTRAHTQKELIQGGGGGRLSERARVRRHYNPLCSTLVAAKNGSVCIAVVLVSLYIYVSIKLSLCDYIYI